MTVKVSVLARLHPFLSCCNVISSEAAVVVTYYTGHFESLTSLAYMRSQSTRTRNTDKLLRNTGIQTTVRTLLHNVLITAAVSVNTDRNKFS